MKFSFAPELIEAAVFLTVRRLSEAGDPEPQRALHRRIDALYTIEDAWQRDEAFVKAYSAAFSSLDLNESLEALLLEQPLIEQRIAQCVVRKVIRAKDETAELFVKPDTDAPERTLVIALRPETLIDPEPLGWVLRHELQHVADMLDACFGHHPSILPEGDSRMRHNLLQDRFRVLWDVYIDGRLTRRGHAQHELRRNRVREFARAFTLPGTGEIERKHAFNRIWDAQQLTCADLARWAKTPEILLTSPEN